MNAAPGTSSGKAGAAAAATAADSAEAASGAAGAAAAAVEGGEGERTMDAADNCGICLENIPSSGKRFGLLNCDHVYCLGTYGGWRACARPSVTAVLPVFDCIRLPALS